MKKLITSIVSLLLIVLTVFSFTSCHMVRVADGEIKAVFRYSDINVSTTLSHEDAEVVRDMFNGKIALPDSAPVTAVKFTISVSGAVSSTASGFFTSSAMWD
jgi:hypothetical protein